ncbi:MAG: phosphoribosylformylglycinamidine cyclo-ligase [Phycisphaerales bacterium]|nr:MAG: phosphoribosylformylglycinamidine cyclo-ligase [Phycisphaerales bacterium]
MAHSPITYKEAGVDISANTRWVGAIRSAMLSTFGPRVMNRDNAFAGLFRLDYDEQLFRRNYRKPVLIACADGVGTKVLLAIQTGRLDTIGIDLVAMNVNDLITCGGEPLFFLDYLGVSALNPKDLATVIDGIAAGCREAGCALLGGETAEMPDVYRPGDLDLAGFAVGVVELDRVVDGLRIKPGDQIVALPSSGVHSNGFTLVRKLIERQRAALDEYVDELGGPLGAALLRPTRIYVSAAAAVARAYPNTTAVTGMAHVTGGGLRENISRVLPHTCNAVIRKAAWTPPPVFAVIRRMGTSRAEMFKVFNMGIGFVFIVRPRFTDGVMNALRGAGEDPILIGEIQKGAARVILK